MGGPLKPSADSRGNGKGPRLRAYDFVFDSGFTQGVKRQRVSRFMTDQAGKSRGGFSVGTGLFVRVLAVAHGVAFLSALTQVNGLVGPHGIEPAQALFAAAKAQVGSAAYWYLPSLCWIFGTGAFLKVLCAVGAALSVVLFLGFAPALTAGLLWFCYLSLCCAGQLFYEFQWDGLLLEASAVAIFLVPWTLAPRWKRFEPPLLGRVLAGWLLFRLMFFSGLVKLVSGDSQWRSLHALRFHFQTQPLPTPLAWYVQQAPDWILTASCFVMFVIELGAPFGLLAPRRIRHACILALIGLQLLIALTGNYTFFNLLTIGLCLPFLDDRFWRKSGQGACLLCPWPQAHRGFVLSAGGVFLGLTVLIQSSQLMPALAASGPVASVASAASPLRTFNTYGLFAVMTTSRPELVFQGSDDGRTWEEYVLPHKPGPLDRCPDWVAPFQPRLDWQLWFAALDSPENNRWVTVTAMRLLKGDPAVLGLFEVNPFPTHPPRYMRVIRYDYSFTDAPVHKNTGQWWRRTPEDVYVPAFSLTR